MLLELTIKVIISYPLKSSNYYNLRSLNSSNVNLSFELFYLIHQKFYFRHMKNKTTATFLALFLGGIGVHRFYLGQKLYGTLYLLFCWTFLPSSLALIDCIIFLVMSKEKFNLKYNINQKLSINPMNNIDSFSTKNEIEFEFFAIDFETACDEISSICQVGLVQYKNGKFNVLIDKLVNPSTKFTNTKIHGISENDVVNSVLFPEIYKEVEKFLVNKVVFTHGGVDEKMFNSACLKYGLPRLNITWLNSATLVRRTWQDYSKSGYGLENMTKVLEIDYNSHNAASDAFATAKIIYLASVKKQIFSIEDWAIELKTKSRNNNNSYVNYDKSQKITGDLTTAPDLNSIENKDNPFFGKKVVISGTYDSWPDRKELAKILKGLGADIDTSIGKKTNILCAGDGVGPKKYQKMELKISQGDAAQILDEERIVSILKTLSID